jgi:dimethylamine monooxygenase subunit A
MTSDAFWLDPPWRGGRGGYRMGLRPIRAEAWLAEPITPAERARKAALLARNAPPVIAALPESGTFAAHVFGLVAARHPVPDDATSAELPLLARAALAVPEDLCIMQRSEAGYRLVAACVCSPSYWSLSEKIGGTLADIHAPVPGLETRIGRPMALFFERLPSDTVFERRNWFLHLDDRLFQPFADDWAAAGPVDPQRLVMRSERQTLARLTAEAVLFTIRVQCRPLAAIGAHPAAARDLRDALAAFDEDERAATGYRYYADAVMPFLDRVVGE